MNNITVAQKTLEIIKNNGYATGDKTVSFPEKEISQVEVISPEYGQELLGGNITKRYNKACNIQVVNMDSFEAALGYEDALVMNFANAHYPGGGFLLGASAQEEALCRRSTLYASITCEAAKKMYAYNNRHVSQVESDYMLLSPFVYVFRDKYLELVEAPERVAVITAPAPDRHGAALFASKKKINETIQRRIRIILRLAAKKEYKTLVLGAWGCGAFGNDPVKVSEAFKTALTEDGLEFCFENVIFAIYGRTDSANFTAFYNTFKGN